MSKTNDASYDVAATSERELTEAELDLVAGGAPPPHYEFGNGYSSLDLAIDFLIIANPWTKVQHECEAFGA